MGDINRQAHYSAVYDRVNASAIVEAALEAAGYTFVASGNEDTYKHSRYTTPSGALLLTSEIVIRENITDMVEALALGRVLMERAETLNRQADELLEPFMKSVMERKDLEEMRKVIDLLPRGFYRSELRTFVIQNTTSD